MSHRLIRNKFICLITVVILLPSTTFALDWQKLIRDVEEQYNGQSSRSKMHMQVSTEHWQRSLTMEAWSLERNRFLIRILKPAKEKGVATLKVEKEVWNYLPKVDRVIKVPPSMMGGAWMGSHITNNDLVKAAHIDEEYDFNLLAETDDSWSIEGIPKPDAPVVWGRVVYQVRKADRVPIMVEYFDEEQEPVRTIRFEDVRKIGERTIPLRMIVQPLDKPEERTLLQYEEIVFDMPIEKNFFSLRQLKKR